MSERAGEFIGVVGGMGPLASAEFLKTIYECGLGQREQESPVVMLYSDPTWPDRTEEFLKDSYDTLLALLTGALGRLDELGASRFVICCMTIHHLLPRLPAHLRERIVSLPDVIFETLLQRQRRHLLVCTSGTRKMRLFESHPQWDRARDYVVLPSDSDQEAIHELIYGSIKKNGHNGSVGTLIPSFLPFLEKYGVDAFIAGCTEVHLLAKYVAGSEHRKDYQAIDPLAIVAQRITEGSL